MAIRKGERSSKKDEFGKNIKLANEYVRLVTRNNSKLIEVFEAEWGWIDATDTEKFTEHYIHWIREKTEKGDLAPSLEVHESIGEISFMTPEFIALVTERFENKKKMLAKLRG